MFIVTWLSHGELDFNSTAFSKLVYDISRHKIMYETCNGIKHVLDCDFGSIYKRLHEIVKSNGFKFERPHNDACDGDYYKFEYNLCGERKEYQGYIYGLILHEEIVSLIEKCAKPVLDDEQRLLNSDSCIEEIVQSRQKLSESFLDIWEDIK